MASECNLGDCVESPVSAPSDVATITWMLNEQSGLWRITEERLGVLRGRFPDLPIHHQSAVQEMLGYAEKGNRYWEIRAEYLAALVNISRLCQKPAVNEIRQVLSEVQVGAARDRVIEEPWVGNVIRLLDRMAEQ